MICLWPYRFFNLMVTLYLLFQPSLTRVSEGCLPGASSCASAVTHGQHSCVCGNSESRPVVVGLEHGKARRGIIGIGCWENKQSLTLESNQVILCSNAMDCFKPPSRTTALNPTPKKKSPTSYVKLTSSLALPLLKQYFPQLTAAKSYLEKGIYIQTTC